MNPHNRLMNLLAKNAGTGKAIRSFDQGDAGLEIYVYDVIDPWFGVSAEAFGKAIRSEPNRPLTVRVNSPGGDAFEGRSIASLIRAHQGPTRVIVDGLAASAASTIAIAAQQTDIADGGFLMIHNAWTLALGGAEDLEDTAQLLRKIDGELAKDYANRAGVSEQQATDWMKAETWFTADEAVQAGLASSVVKSAAEFEAFNLAAFNKAPKALLDRLALPTQLQIRESAARRLRLFEALA